MAFVWALSPTLISGLFVIGGAITTPSWGRVDRPLYQRGARLQMRVSPLTCAAVNPVARAASFVPTRATRVRVASASRARAAGTSASVWASLAYQDCATFERRK